MAERPLSHCKYDNVYRRPHPQRRDRERYQQAGEENETTSVGVSLHELIASIGSSSSSSSRAVPSVSDFDDEDCDEDVDNVGERWREVVERCNSHPDEILVKDRRGRTCLHAVAAAAACVRTQKTNAPQAVVVDTMLSMAVLAAAAAPTRQEHQRQQKDREDECLAELLAQKDKHGRTPLSIAISCGADTGVIELLLSGPSSHSRNTAAAAAVAAKVAAANDHLGYLPLHLACSGWCTEEVAGTVSANNEAATAPQSNALRRRRRQQIKSVRLLLRCYPEGAKHESFNGRTPLHCALEGRATLEVVQELVKGTDLFFRCIICC